jgi:hypothetical protein
MRIHIHSRKGLYTVVSYDEKVINLMTKAYKFSVPVQDFKCFAGGNNNFGVSEQDKDKFYLTITKAENMGNVRKFLKKLFTPQPVAEVKLYKKDYFDGELPF